MAQMNTSKKLIKKLTKELKPAPFKLTTLQRFFIWLTASLLVTFLGIAFIGLRFDFLKQINQPLFWIDLILPFTISLGAASIAFKLALPGQKPPLFFKWFLLTLLLIWIANGPVNLFIQNLNEGKDIFRIGHGVFCVKNIGVMLFLPVLFIFYLIQSLAPLKRNEIGFWIMLSVSALAQCGAYLICPNNEVMHLLVYHVLPTVFFAVIGLLLGGIFFRKI